VGIGTLGVEITNLLIADRVLPMEVGGVLSAATAAMERRESEEEVAVGKEEESLVMESTVLLFSKPDSLESFRMRDIFRLDF
jgi:hypothetical protein